MRVRFSIRLSIRNVIRNAIPFAKRMQVMLPLFLLTTALPLSSCGKDKGGSDSSPDPDPAATPAPTPQPQVPTPGTDDPPPSLTAVDPWEHPPELHGDDKMWWLNKASRQLRGREANDDERERWRELDPRDVLREMMVGQEFEDRAFDFFLHVLGFGGRPLRKGDGTLGQVAYDFPQAVAAALALREDSDDMLRFFDFYHARYMEPVGRVTLPSSVEQPREPEPSFDPADYPRMIRHMAHEQFVVLKQNVVNLDDPEARTPFCAPVVDDESIFLPNLLTNYGISAFTAIAFRLEFDDWFRGIYFFCNISPSTGGTAFKPDLASIEALEERYFVLLDELDRLRNQNNAATRFDELSPLDSDAVSLPPMKGLSLITFVTDLQNSSTNMNRRRASYVLKRYFCDDLTPVNLEAPDDHAADQHGSDPSCQACHYKLDPMAGFFKNLGAGGLDFSGLPVIAFDDQAVVPREEYINQWRETDPTSGRAWQTGYIRSAKDESLNTYGESLTDLFAIIKSSKESKQCLMRRVFEYHVGENQVIDPQYLEYLTERFIVESDQGSAGAFKRAVGRVLLGASFRERDLNSSQCYDFAPGPIDSSRPPCAIAHILERNCNSCHNAQGASGGLDLSRWVLDAHGDPTFPHSKGENQFTRDETLQLMLDRITSGDETLRMPLRAHFPTRDRDELFLWLQGQLSKSNPLTERE